MPAILLQRLPNQPLRRSQSWSTGQVGFDETMERRTKPTKKLVAESAGPVCFDDVLSLSLVSVHVFVVLVDFAHVLRACLSCQWPTSGLFWVVCLGCRPDN
jgi:hypothetical protein